MNKRNLILGSMALLLVTAGTWGILAIRARTSVRAAVGTTTALCWLLGASVNKKG